MLGVPCAGGGRHWAGGGGMLPCRSGMLRDALDAGPRQRGESPGAQHGAVPSSLFQRKSWKRRYFVLDEFSISYYKCEQVSSPCLGLAEVGGCCALVPAAPWEARPSAASPSGQWSPSSSPLLSAGQGAPAFDSPEGRLQDPRVPGQVWVMLPSVFPQTVAPAGAPGCARLSPAHSRDGGKYGFFFSIHDGFWVATVSFLLFPATS